MPPDSRPSPAVVHWVAEHRRSLLLLLAILTLGGVLMALRLPVALFPQVSFPRVVVSIDAGDRPADQMVIAVTQLAEQAVREVPGVKSVRSITSRGSAELSINFGWGDDIALGYQLVDSAIGQVLPSLPAGSTYRVRRMDPTVFPVIAYSLTSPSLSLVSMRDTALYTLVPLLTDVDGVAKVTVLGGESAEIRVEVDPLRLASYRLTVDDVVTALSAANVLEAVGRLEDHYKLYLVLSDTRLASLEGIRNTVLRSGSNGMVRLSDIANVYDATEPQWVRVTADGTDAVLLQIYQQPGANTVQIANDIKQRLADFTPKLPAGLALQNWYDQSELIVSSAASVRDAIIVGVLLAGLVLLAFLRSTKLTFIAILIVPAVLAATIVTLFAFGMSFNIMTLGGMAAAVGLIVDDAIVMIEHIVRRLRQRGNDRLGTIRSAAIEFTRPLTGSSAATIVIFLPLAFLSGVTGSFFKALSLTMAASLVFSYLAAWLVVPLLAEFLLSEADAQSDESGPLMNRVSAAHQRLLRGLNRRRWAIPASLAALAGIGVLAYVNVGSGFIPPMDEGGFVLDYRAPAGTSLSETDRLLRQAEAIISANPAVRTYSRRTGVQLGGGLTEANEGDYFIRLKPFPRPGIETVMDDLRATLNEQVPGIEVEMVLLMEDLIGDLTAVPQPVEIKLYGARQEELMTIARKVAERIGTVRGVVDVLDGIVLAGDALNIIVDRDKAALEGISPDQVTRQARDWLTGNVTTEVQGAQKMIGIRVWLPGDERAGDLDVNGILLTAADGHQFPLKRIATVTKSIGQPQVNRDNLKTIVAVTGRISGRDLGSTVAEIETLLNAPDLLPSGISYTLGGLYAQQRIAFRGLLAVFAAAIALVFLLLVYLYEDFAVALVVMLNPLLALSAVFTGLWLTGTELSITAMMGMTMIVGIITEVSIFYFSEFRELCAEDMPVAEAAFRAGSNRLRPILMTTLAAALALLPLALGIGEGSAMQQPLAIAIISGLVVQAPLVLLLMPAIYLWLNDRLHHGDEAAA